LGLGRPAGRVAAQMETGERRKKDGKGARRPSVDSGMSALSPMPLADNDLVRRCLEKEHPDMHWVCGVAATFLVTAALLDLPGVGGPWWTWGDKESSLWADPDVGDPCGAGLTSRCEAMRATRTLVVMSLLFAAAASGWCIMAYNLLKECMFASAVFCALACTAFHLLAISNALAAPLPAEGAKSGGLGFSCFVTAFSCCIFGCFSLVAAKLLIPKPAEVVDVSVGQTKEGSTPEKGEGRKARGQMPPKQVKVEAHLEDV